MRAWLATRAPRIVVEWLPAYAPECNPVEAVWSHAKYGDLANFAPADLEHLAGAVLGSFTRTRGTRPLLAAFFRAADLRILRCIITYARVNSTIAESVALRSPGEVLWPHGDGGR